MAAVVALLQASLKTKDVIVKGDPWLSRISNLKSEVLGRRYPVA